jgi:hypothetical protein
MPSNNGTASPSRESQGDVPSPVSQMAQVFTLSREDMTIMREHIEEFEKGNKDFQNTIIENTGRGVGRLNTHFLQR